MKEVSTILIKGLNSYSLECPWLVILFLGAIFSLSKLVIIFTNTKLKFEFKFFDY